MESPRIVLYAVANSRYAGIFYSTYPSGAEGSFFRDMLENFGKEGALAACYKLNDGPWSPIFVLKECMGALLATVGLKKYRTFC